MNNLIKNGLLLVVTVVLTLLLSEAIVRQVFNPVDYLLPQLDSDPVLGHRIAPRSGGHDDWGFRNKRVPDTADIVAIGDSQTYGVSATSLESWPAHLSKLTNKDVYNLALGGYGPLQYLHLLKTKALTLNPKIVIIGLYFGNDLVDAYNLANSNPNWLTYKGQEVAPTGNEITAVPTKEQARLFSGIRTWLAGNSVLYRVATQSFLGNLVRENEYKQVHKEVIDVSLENVRQFFSISYRLHALNNDLTNVSEGIRISKEALIEISEISIKNNIRILVVLIPTKEIVYAELLHNKLGANLAPALKAQIGYENLIRDDFFEFFSDTDIEYIDVLPALRSGAQQGKPIYPVNDGHPTGLGYALIARSIFKTL